MSCSCGQCDECRSDPCEEISKQIIALDSMQRALVSELESAASMAELRKSFMELGGPYVPAAAAEDAERDARKKLAEIVQERQRLLARLCDACPSNPECTPFRS